MSEPQKPTVNNPVTLDGQPLPYFPIGDRVFVGRTNEEDVQTKAGIIIPGRSGTTLNYGVILAAGPQALDVLYDAGISIGDRVMWGRYAGDPLQWRSENAGVKEIYVVNVKDIWGCAELCEAIASGDVAIANVNEGDSTQPTEHRFLRAEREPEVVKRSDGAFVAAKQGHATREDLENELKALKDDHRQAHMKQNVDEMEVIQGRMNEIKKHLKIFEAQG